MDRVSPQSCLYRWKALLGSALFALTTLAVLQAGADPVTISLDSSNLSTNAPESGAITLHFTGTVNVDPAWYIYMVNWSHLYNASHSNSLSSNFDDAFMAFAFGGFPGGTGTYTGPIMNVTVPAGTPPDLYAFVFSSSAPSAFSVTVRNFNQPPNQVTASQYFSVQVTSPLAMSNAVSRKTHGGAGTFDIDLLNANFGPECRSSGGNHTLVFTFTNNVTSGNASVASGTGSVSGSPSFSSNTMTVNLTGVTDVQKTTVTLSNVTDSFAQVLPDTAVSMNMLIGDVNGNKSVNSTDVSQTKLQSGQAVTAANFRADVIVTGSINGTDVSAVKLRVGSGVP